MAFTNLAAGDAVRQVQGTEAQHEAGLLPSVYGGLPESQEAAYTDARMETLEAFLTGNCDATRAKYAAEMNHHNAAWRKALDLRYAESLVSFGKLERLVKPLKRGGRIVGGRIWFRKTPESTTRLYKSAQTQTEAAA